MIDEKNNSDSLSSMSIFDIAGASVASSSISSPTSASMASTSMGPSLFASAPIVSSVSPMPMSSPISMASSSLASSSMVSSVSSTPMPSSSSLAVSSPMPDYVAIADQKLYSVQGEVVRLRDKFRNIGTRISPQTLPQMLPQALPDVPEAYGRAVAAWQAARQFTNANRRAEAFQASIVAISEAKNAITQLKQYSILVRQDDSSHSRGIYPETDYKNDFALLSSIEMDLDNVANALKSQMSRDYPSPMPSASSTPMSSSMASSSLASSSIVSSVSSTSMSSSMASSSIASSSMASSAIPTPSSTPIPSSAATPATTHGSKEDYVARAITDYNAVASNINYFSQRYRGLGLLGNPQEVFRTALTAQSELQAAALAAQSSTDAKSAADQALIAANQAKIAFGALNIICQEVFRNAASERANLANLTSVANFVVTKEQVLRQEIARQFPVVSPTPPPPSASVSMASSTAVSPSIPPPPSYPPPPTPDEKKEQAAQALARGERVKLYFLSSPEGRLKHVDIIRQDEKRQYDALQQISVGSEARAKAHKLIQVPSNDSEVVANDKTARARLEKQAAEFWNHYLDRLGISIPRSSPEYTAQLNEKAKYLDCVVTNYGIVLVPNPAKPNDPFPWFHSQKASDEFVSNMERANSGYVQVLSSNRVAACVRVPELSGQGAKVGDLTAAHIKLGRHALEAGVDVSLIRTAGISKTDTFVKRAENELSAGRAYSSLPKLASDQLSIFERWSNDDQYRPSWGSPVSDFAQNIRVAITQGKDGRLRLVVTTFDPTQEGRDSFSDQMFCHYYAVLKFADMGITANIPKCSGASAQRQAFAALLGSNEDKPCPLNFTPGSGSNHQELMQVWNDAIKSGNPPSMSVFSAMMSYSGQKVKTGFFGFSTADKGTVYREHLLKCFDEIRNPQARLEAVFNFTMKADQKIRAALNADTTYITFDQHQQNMQSWLTSLQAHSPQLAQTVVQRAATRVEQIRVILESETDPAKIEKLWAEANSAQAIVNLSSYQPQKTAVSDSVRGISQIPKVQEYLQNLAAKKAEQEQHDQQEDKELKRGLDA